MTQAKRRLMIVVGTRPEAIKLAPVALGALAQPDAFEVVLVATGQHRDMLRQALLAFDLRADVDLDIMTVDQDLRHITTAALDGLVETIGEVHPDWVVVQGDTTTTFTAALAAFYRRCPVAHVEAGLRTFDRRQPWPEEMNRVLTGQLAAVHFAPTQRAADNLVREGISADRVFVTGNTAIDALHLTRARLAPDEGAPPPGRRRLLVTLHRRENHGPALSGVCDAIVELAQRFADIEIVFAVHPNPAVRGPVHAALAGRPRITLCEPLGYRDFVAAMAGAHVILTDSGGVQEEAPALGKPVLVLRNVTERPEAVDADVARLVGTDPEAVVREVSRLMEDDAQHARMARGASPYGDGHAAERILRVLRDPEPGA